MKVHNAKLSHDIVLKPLEDRWYEVQGAFSITLTTDCGVILITVDNGFMFDGRSGGPMVDTLGVAPNLGSQDEIKCWLIHDINAYGKTLSYNDTNTLLYNMLRDAGYGWVRAKMIYTAVNFSDSWYGEPAYYDREYPNLSKIHVRHYDKH